MHKQRHRQGRLRPFPATETLDQIQADAFSRSRTECDQPQADQAESGRLRNRIRGIVREQEECRAAEPAATRGHEGID